MTGGEQPVSAPSAAWRHRFALAAAAYFLLALLSKPSLPFWDLPTFWVPTARTILDGDLLSIYAHRFTVIGLDFPNSYPPLLFLMVTPFIHFAEAWGLGDFFGAGGAVALVPFLIFDALAARELVRTLGHVRPRSSEAFLFQVYCLFLFSPLLWFATVRIHHHESMLVYFSLLFLRKLLEERMLPAGLLLGMAFLSKAVAAFVYLPAVLWLAFRGRWRLAAGVTGLGAGLAALVMAPFFIRDFDNTYYSLVGFESMRPIIGTTIWKFAQGGAWEPFALRSANWILLGVTAVVCTAWFARRHRTPVELLAGVALSMLSFALLAKWMGPHYFLPGFALFLLWQVAASERDGAGSYFASVLFLFLFLNIQLGGAEAIFNQVSPAILLRSAVWFLFVAAAIAFVVRRTPRGEAPADAA